MMIPPELVSLIASHLTPTDQPSSVMFDIPLSYQLHRLITVPLCLTPPSLPTLPPNLAPRSGPPISVPLPQPLKAPRPNSTNLVNLLWNQSFVRKAFISSSAKSSDAHRTTSYSLSVASNVGAHASASPYRVMSGRRAGRPSSVSLPPAARAPSLDYSVGSNEKMREHLTRYA